MSYSELLNYYIEESGLTIGDIAKRVKAQGVDIDRTFISMLKNNKTKPPASEEINRALAEATGGNGDRLVLCAFAEQAPEMVRDMLHYSFDAKAVSPPELKLSSSNNTIQSFSLLVQDDNMTGDRILRGDYAIGVRQEEVTPRDIAVVAVNGGQPFLTRIRREGDQWLLMPSNPSVQPSLLQIHEISIIGKIKEVHFKVKC